MGMRIDLSCYSSSKREKEQDVPNSDRDRTALFIVSLNLLHLRSQLHKVRAQSLCRILGQAWGTFPSGRRTLH